jgi:hypothetical protein
MKYIMILFMLLMGSLAYYKWNEAIGIFWLACSANALWSSIE